MLVALASRWRRLIVERRHDHFLGVRSVHHAVLAAAGGLLPELQLKLLVAAFKSGHHGLRTGLAFALGAAMSLLVWLRLRSCTGLELLSISDDT